jgi:hypothetical protein
MSLRRALFIAVCMFPIVAGPAAAQAPWPDAQQSQPPQQQPAPWPSAPAQQAPAAVSPWTQQPQQEPPCIREFGVLREEAQKRAKAIQVASERKVSPREACNLFNAFSAVELKMVKYAADNQASCGIPPQVITQLKQSHARTTDMQTKVCRVAAAPPKPAGPSLSDALTAPVPSSSNIKTGRGTFDTLTGTPLGPK